MTIRLLIRIPVTACYWYKRTTVAQIVDETCTCYHNKGVWRRHHVPLLALLPLTLPLLPLPYWARRGSECLPLTPYPLPNQGEESGVHWLPLHLMNLVGAEGRPPTPLLHLCTSYILTPSPRASQLPWGGDIHPNTRTSSVVIHHIVKSKQGTHTTAALSSFCLLFADSFWVFYYGALTSDAAVHILKFSVSDFLNLFIVWLLSVNVRLHSKYLC